MKEVGKRIRQARVAKNLKQDELAELIGAKYKSVSAWECGISKPDCLTLLRICKALNVAPDQILGYPSEDLNSDEWSMIRKYRYIDDFGKQAVDAVLNVEYKRAFDIKPKKQRVRLLKLDYYSFPASAGNGNFLDTEMPEEIFVKETSEAENADFVIPIRGDSMEPTYHDGDKVFVEKRDTVEEGEIGIFIINGEAYIKELGNKCLISHNKAYRPIPLNPTDSVYCCGKVLGVVEEKNKPTIRC